MEDLYLLIAFSFIIHLIFGCITVAMNNNKGYQGGFLWGFILGILGIIIVALRPFNMQQNSMGNNYPPYGGMGNNYYPQYGDMRTGYYPPNNPNSYNMPQNRMVYNYPPNYDPSHNNQRNVSNDFYNSNNKQ